MEKIKISTEIENIIVNAKAGKIFIISDFTDISEYETAKKTLLRLEKAGVIKRALRGVYYKPEYSKLLQEYVEADPNEIAKAIARNFNWTIAPSGDYALNLLGLSTQVPATWSYVSDGPYRKFDYENIKIEFMHRTNREISGISYKTALVIQAIKTLGEDKIDENVINQIRKVIKEEKYLVLKESQNTTSWIYSTIKKICGKSE